MPVLDLNLDYPQNLPNFGRGDLIYVYRQTHFLSGYGLLANTCKKWYYFLCWDGVYWSVLVFMTKFSKKKIIACQSVRPGIDFVVMNTIVDGVGYFHAVLLSGWWLSWKGSAFWIKMWGKKSITGGWNLPESVFSKSHDISYLSVKATGARLKLRSRGRKSAFGSSLLYASQKPT